MTKTEVFFGIINPLIQEHLNNIEVSELEKLSMQIKIYDIFQNNDNLDDIYHELLEYMVDDLRHTPLIQHLDHQFDKFNPL